MTYADSHVTYADMTLNGGNEELMDETSQKIKEDNDNEHPNAHYLCRIQIIDHELISPDILTI